MTSSLVAFARALFEGEGVVWEEASDGCARLSLAEPMSSHFGAASLSVACRDGAPGETLAVGSRLFDAMVAWLGGRGRCAAIALPRAQPVVPVAGPEVERRCTVTALPEEAADRRYLVYDFQLAFLTEERHEALWSVALDEHGRVQDGVLERLAAIGAVEEARQEPPGSNVALLADRLGRAEQLARAEAERQANSHERLAADRLKAVAERLTTYYAELEAELPVRRRKGQTTAEADAEWEVERRALRQGLARRLEAEARRHQLRVLVRALGCATFVVPGRRMRWRLDGGGMSREVSVWQDLASGRVFWTACARCGAAEGRFGLCRSGHVVCPGCLGACARCGEAACRAELSPCRVCGGPLCAACGAGCLGGHRVCADHLATCGCCGCLVCEACASPCPRCPDAAWLAPGHACPRHAEDRQRPSRSLPAGANSATIEPPDAGVPGS